MNNIYLHLRKSRDPRSRRRRRSAEEEAQAEAREWEAFRIHEKILLGLVAQDGNTVAPENIIREIESGEYLAERREFLRHLEAWEKLPPGAGGLLYTMEVARLTRGEQIEQGRVYGALQKAGILIRHPGGTADLNDPTDELLTIVKGALARNELQTFKWRVANTRSVQVQQGEIRNGKDHFGYRWDKNTMEYVLVPEEFPRLQALIKDAFTMSTHELAKVYGLNQSRVLYILRHPTICGYPVQHTTKNLKKGGKARQLLPRDQWIWPTRPGNYPAACTREEWEALQEVLDARAKTRARPGTEDGWCRDILRFAGGEDRPARLSAIGSAHQPVYELSTPRQGSRPYYVARETVHTAAAAALKRIMTDPALPALLTRYLTAREREPLQQREQKARLWRQIRQQEQRFERAVALEIDAEGDKIAVLRQQQDEIRAEKRRLEAELKRLQKSIVAIPALDRFLAEFDQKLARHWEAVWNDRQVTTAIRRRWVNAFVKRVVVEVSPVDGRRAWRREVVAVEYHEIFAAVMSKER